MIDILQIANEVFGSSYLVSCEEVMYEFWIRYRMAASALPAAERLTYLYSKCLERDSMDIQFLGVEKIDLINIRTLVESGKYETYRSQVEPDDPPIDVAIRIQKKFDDENISVYNIEKFTEFLCSHKIEENLRLFTGLFTDVRQHICFQVLNCDICICTDSIAFAPGPRFWSRSVSRHDCIKNCNDSCVFLGRTQYTLVPQDFAITEQRCDGHLERIERLFDGLRNVLSFLYIANTSNVVGDKAVLQFDPAVNGYEYTLEQLDGNDYAWIIYSWIYKDEGCVGRAGIARNIIDIHCKTADAVLNIDESIYNSAVANHVIYQRKHAEQYIELKNKLSEFIVESAEQLQELAHDLAEGFRNNFVAVIVFLMTVLLTDSIDFSSFTQAKVSSNIVAVCGIFTFASLLYMVVTIIAGNTKWGWLEKSYDNLKNNYKGVLDELDIEKAVNYDAAFDSTKKEYKNVRLIIVSIWTLAVVGMLAFTVVIGYNNQNSDATPTNTYQPDEQGIDQAEPGVSEEGISENSL